MPLIDGKAKEAMQRHLNKQSHPLLRSRYRSWEPILHLTKCYLMNRSDQVSHCRLRKEQSVLVTAVVEESHRAAATTFHVRVAAANHQDSHEYKNAQNRLPGEAGICCLMLTSFYHHSHNDHYHQYRQYRQYHAPCPWVLWWWWWLFLVFLYSGCNWQRW